MSEALLLGTGSADGWPNPFCTCSSCSAERLAGRLRGQTSVLVDGRLLLDAGPETPRAAARHGADLDALQHVLITHQHPDHCSPAFLLFRSWVRRVAEEPLDVVGPPGVVEAARRWVAPDAAVRFLPVGPGDRLRLGDYDVRVHAARHGAPGSAVLYDVTTSDGRLLYATDTGRLPEGTLQALEAASFDLVLLEETFGDVPDHGSDHLDLVTFPDQLRRLRANGAITDRSHVVAVHLSHHNPPTPELSRRLADWGAVAVDDGARLSLRAKPAAVAAPSDRADDPGTSTAGVVRRTLVLGGARSGKSREAERILAAEGEVTYVATSYPAGDDAGDDAVDDQEWAERIRLHRERRPHHWHTTETLDVAGLLHTDGGPVLVDCLTLWLTRLMDRHGAWDDATWAATAEKAVAAEIDTLVDAWRGTRRRVVAVSNEVGQGVVPHSASGRRFRDLMGRLNARLAAASEDVRWCVAGRVQQL